MANYIDRQAALDKLQTEIDEQTNPLIRCGIRLARNTIDELPSAQTEIIHCGNCKHHSDEKPGMVYCPEIIGGWVKNNCVCAIWEGNDDV